MSIYSMQGLKPLPRMKDIKKMIAPYQRSDNQKAVGQLLNSLLPYIALWAVAVAALKVSFWLALPAILLNALFLVRLFILFHDCGHNALFSSTQINRVAGFWLGVLVWTPGEKWWHAHAIHHATSSNLDKRGIGDVMTLTVEEYRQLPRLRQWGYRFFRSPWVMFLLGPIYIFLIGNRLPFPRFGKKETQSVWLTNLALLVIAGIMSYVVGWKAYFLIQMLIIELGGMLGIWLFYIQHQFTDVYWARSQQWDYVASALHGASFYRLPGLLHWFSGNIGFHTLHHLSPRIPNYLLPACFEANPALREASRSIGLLESFRYAGLGLWDEQSGRMVRFKDLDKPGKSS